MKQYIVVVGSPVEGCSFYGPFEDSEDACKFAEANLENELENNTLAIKRWSRRLIEAETELQALTEQRLTLNNTLLKVKERI